MAIKTTDDSNYSDIAAAIRAKLETEDVYYPREMAAAISSIPVGEPDWTKLGYDGAPIAVMNGFEYSEQIKTNWDETITNRNNAFRDSVLIRFFPEVDTSNIQNASYMFNGAKSLVSVDNLELPDCTNARNMFNECSGLGSAKVGPFKSSGCDGQYMFINCRSLTDVTVDFTGLNDVNRMFAGCYNLTNIDFSNTSSITNAERMFESTWWINSDINLDLPHCLSCNGMFINSFQYNWEATGEDHKYGIGDACAIFDITLNIPLCTTLQDFCYGGNVGNNGIKSVHLTTGPSLANLYNAFTGGHSNLQTIEISDTSGCENFIGAFNDTMSLVNLSTLDFSAITDTNKLQNMFGGVVKSLSDESLDGILQACANCPATTGTKTLYYLGLRESYSGVSTYPVSRISALDHYTDFIDANWEIGWV